MSSVCVDMPITIVVESVLCERPLERNDLVPTIKYALTSTEVVWSYLLVHSLNAFPCLYGILFAWVFGILQWSSSDKLNWMFTLWFRLSTNTLKIIDENSLILHVMPFLKKANIPYDLPILGFHYLFSPSKNNSSHEMIWYHHYLIKLNLDITHPLQRCQDMYVSQVMEKRVIVFYIFNVCYWFERYFVL